MKELKTLVVNGEEFAIKDAGSVAFDSKQNLPPEKQAQAIENIGAVSQQDFEQRNDDIYFDISYCVSAAESQTFTDDQKALVRENIGAAKAGKYELIETFTFEQTSTFSRGQEPDGTPYNFEALFFHIVIPAGTNVTDGSFWFYDTKGTNFAHRWTAAATANEQPLIYHGRIYRSNGIWCWYLPGEFRANGSSPIMYDEVRGNITDIVNDKKIGSIWFAQTFPVGTVINIYGVRA